MTQPQPLPAAISTTNAPDNALRFGVVTGVNPLTINVQGGTFEPGHASGYAPVQGDNVAVLRQDDTWFVLGGSKSSTGPGVGSGFIFARTAGTQPVANGSSVNATYDTTLYNPALISVPAGIFTVPTGWDGVYDLSGSCRYSANATGFRLLAITVNGTGICEARFDANTTGGNPTGMNASTPYPLRAGDTVNLGLFQNSGGPLTVGGPGPDQTIFSALWRASLP